MRCNRCAARRRGCRIPAGIDGTIENECWRCILCVSLVGRVFGRGRRVAGSFLMGEFAMNRNVFAYPLLAEFSAGERERRESFLLGDLTMNRVVFLSAMAVLVVGLLVASAWNHDHDNFGTSHDYLGGVAGTIWDGTMNAGNATTFNANTGNAGQLTVTTVPRLRLGGTHVNAPFLYKNVSASNDFTAEVTVSAANFASYVSPGLLVYKDNGDFVGANANHLLKLATHMDTFRADRWWERLKPTHRRARWRLAAIPFI